MKPCLSPLRLRIPLRSRSFSFRRGSASASPLARVKGEMGRVPKRHWRRRLFQPRALWHQDRGPMRNPSCLSTPRSAPRRKGRAIVAVVAKFGPCSFVPWQRFAAAVHAAWFSRGLFGRCPLRIFVSTRLLTHLHQNRCDILPDTEPPLCQHCKQYGFDCTFFLPIAETRFKKKKQEEEAAAAAAAAVVEKARSENAERANSSTPGESSRPTEARVYGTETSFR